MTKLSIVALLPLALLAACSESAQTKATEQRIASTQVDKRLPAGFTIFHGGSTVRELAVVEPATGGKIVTFSIDAPLNEVMAHYRREADAAGLAYAGRMNGGEIMSYEARREGEGAPRKFGATALRKGEFTNVTLMFDVTA
jgi:hypothetical protein